MRDVARTSSSASSPMAAARSRARRKNTRPIFGAKEGKWAALIKKLGLVVN